VEKSPTQKPTGWQSKLKESLPLLYLVVALFALRYSLVEPYVVPTPSMEPTLKKGDRLYALKCAYDLRFPFTNWTLFQFKPVRQGDVILFRAPHEPDKIYVKRAVAVAGDKIEVRDGGLVVNGQPVPRVAMADRDIMYDIDNAPDKTLFLETENGVKHYSILDNYRPNYRDFPESHPGAPATGPIEVPAGFVFAMGDNRDQSYDSRGWGFVPLDNLKGQAMFIWFSSWDWKLRPERIGTLIQ
jgi:signal peptidase I